MSKEGDEVSARVVEVDRRAKRITGSLQSDARTEDERASIDARQKRRYIIKNKDGKKKKMNPDEEEGVDSKEAARSSPAAAKVVIKAPRSITKAPVSIPNAPPTTRPSQQKDESQMTPAELKRAI
jgi:ribosomal protein S1